MHDYAKIKELQSILLNSRSILFLGGAGVSTESGLSDFRSEKAREACIRRFSYPPEIILSADFFARETALFYDYYRAFLLQDAEPNAAHYALAKLERSGRLNAVITQNIDLLHEKAGSRRVLKLHGSIDSNRCMRCGAIYNAAFMRSSEGIVACPACGGLIKPEVTLYDEPVDDYVFRNARACMFSVDTLLIGGTSLSVYPAASLPEFFMGKRLVILNQSETPLDSQATLILCEPIGSVFEALERLG